MGMFDYVNYTCKCPNCDELVTDFQSKSGPCELKTLRPQDVSNFYGYCNACGEHIEFNATKSMHYHDFERVV